MIKRLAMPSRLARTRAERFETGYLDEIRPDLRDFRAAACKNGPAREAKSNLLFGHYSAIIWL